MRSETRPAPPKQMRIKEMFTRVMTVAELLSKASENHAPKQQSGSEKLQKTQK